MCSCGGEESRRWFRWFLFCECVRVCVCLCVYMCTYGSWDYEWKDFKWLLILHKEVFLDSCELCVSVSIKLNLFKFLNLNMNNFLSFRDRRIFFICHYLFLFCKILNYIIYIKNGYFCSSASYLSCVLFDHKQELIWKQTKKMRKKKKKKGIRILRVVDRLNRTFFWKLSLFGCICNVIFESIESKCSRW